jgi:hypothetical protein
MARVSQDVPRIGRTSGTNEASSGARSHNRRCSVSRAVARSSSGASAAQLAQERADGEVGGPPGVGLGGTLGELRQAEMVAELVGEPGFADPGLAHQADGLTPPAAGALPGLAESRELGP